MDLRLKLRKKPPKVKKSIAVQKYPRPIHDKNSHVKKLLKQNSLAFDPAPVTEVSELDYSEKEKFLEKRQLENF